MFYCFSQNNSGGGFDIDDNVAHFVIIEADSAFAANDRAESIGIYFDGCETGNDCPCCGDRWTDKWSDDSGDEAPVIYGTPVAEHKNMWVDQGKPYAYVYYADGRKETFRS